MAIKVDVDELIDRLKDGDFHEVATLMYYPDEARALFQHIESLKNKIEMLEKERDRSEWLWLFCVLGLMALTLYWVAK